MSRRLNAMKYRNVAYFARGKNWERVQVLVERGANVNDADDSRVTALHWAAGYGNKEMCSFLISHGANVSLADKDGNQPLHFAARNHGDLSSDICRCLLDHEADATAINNDGNIPLHIAFLGFRLPFVCSSLITTETVNVADRYGCRPLHLAGRKGDVTAVLALVEFGADLNAMNVCGRTPLLYTLEDGLIDDGTCFEIGKILLEPNVEVNAEDHYGNQALHLACKQGYTKTAVFLMSNGAFVNSVNKHGQTPLHMVADADRDCPKLCDALLQHHAKISSVDDDGNQPLHLACRRPNSAIGRMLLSHGADVTALNKQMKTPIDLANERLAIRSQSRDESDGNSPLHVAAKGGQIQTVQLLVDFGVCANLVNQLKQTPLHMAASGISDSPELCNVLLQQHCKISAADADGNTPLHLACKRGHTNTSILLVCQGAFVNSVNRHMQTPLHTVAGGDKDCPELCNVLMQHNADINSVDDDGNQPLHLACIKLLSATGSMLLSHGADVKALNKQMKCPLDLANEAIISKSFEYDGNSPLHIAAKGQIQTLQLLVDFGVCTNLLNELKQTPLHIAASGYIDSPELCKVLLEQQSKVSAKDADGNQPLHLACKEGHTKTGVLLISHGAFVNSVNKHGQTPLHMVACADKDCPELCDALLQHHAKISSVDDDGNQPLHFACINLHSATVRMLISIGASLTALNKQMKSPLHLANEAIISKPRYDGNNALHVAARESRIHHVQLLIDCGSCTNLVNELKQTPLHMAASGLLDSPELCNVLLQQHSDVNAADVDGNQPLHLACKQFHSKASQVLISNGAFVNAVNTCGATPLHTSTDGVKDCPELCSVLLQNNARIDAVDKDGNQPLHLASKQSHTATSILLISKGAFVNAVNTCGQTPLHKAAGGKTECPELCVVLLQNEANINAVEKYGNQPLHLACKQCHTAKSKLLISNGAFVNAVNTFGQTPLHLAAGGDSECLEVCRVLLQNNAKIDAEDEDGNQPLHLACKRRYTETSSLLITKGAFVNAVNMVGQTPLHMSMGGKKGCPKLCNVLLQNSAKIDAMDEDGNQPLHLACRRLLASVVSLLVSHGADTAALNKQQRKPLHLAEESLLKSWHSRKEDDALHIAARRGQFELVQLLFVCGAPKDAVNKHGQTLLHTAACAKTECLKLCEILLQQNSKVDAADEDGNQPLHMACKQGNAATSQLFLKHGAKANAVNRCGETPLHKAVGVETWFCQILDALMQHHASINAADKNGNRPLHLACEVVLTGTVQDLLGKNADVNAANTFKQTALHKAACAKKDSAMVCSMLIRKGARTNAADVDGNTPLHLACFKGNSTTVRVLVENGADYTVLNMSWETLLHAACKNRADFVKFCEYLVSLEVSPCITDKEGNLPLHVAFKYGNALIFCYLFEQLGGSTLDDFPEVAIDKNGFKSILDNVTQYSDTETCRRILEYSAKSKPSNRVCLKASNCQDTTGYAVLQMAVKKGDFRLCQLLIDHGASVNASVVMPNNYRSRGRVCKEPPLHLAAKGGYTDLCRLLLDNGAGVNTRVEGRTALQLAIVGGKTNAVTLLLSHGADFSKVVIDEKSALRVSETIASIIQANGE